ISLMTMAMTRRHQAVHDLVTRTTVQVRDLSRVEEFGVLHERPADWDMTYPSLWRRMAVTALYVITLMLITGAFTIGLMSDSCIDEEICGANDRMVSVIGSLTMLGGMFAFVILGWRGRLPGARG